MTIDDIARCMRRNNLFTVLHSSIGLRQFQTHCTVDYSYWQSHTEMQRGTGRRADFHVHGTPNSLGMNSLDMYVLGPCSQFTVTVRSQVKIKTRMQTQKVLKHPVRFGPERQAPDSTGS